jgi:hypothetical protein
MLLKKVVFEQTNRAGYFTLALSGFLAAFLLLPSAKMVNNYYYMFLALPAFIVLCRALSGGKTFALGAVESILWATLLFWCLIRGASDEGIKYAIHTIYTVLFLIIAGRFANPAFFHNERFARGQYWILVAYILLSMLVNWINEGYMPGMRLHPLPSRMRASTYMSIWLGACFMLALPVWLRRKAWPELFLALISAVSLIAAVLQSRSGLVALAVALSLIASACFFLSSGRVLLRSIVGAAAFCVVCALIWYLLPILQELIQHPENQYSEEWCQLPRLQQFVFRADAHRFELWGNFLKDWHDCGLWAGCGPTFETQRPLLNGLIPYPHNIYLAFGIYYGLPALLLFLALCFYTLKVAWCKRDPWGAYLLTSLSGLFFEGNQIINSPNESWLLVLLPMALIAHPGLSAEDSSNLIDSKDGNFNF